VALVQRLNLTTKLSVPLLIHVVISWCGLITKILKMKKYKSKLNGKVAIIVSDKAAGMCNKTLGVTMVVYKYEGDTYDYPFVMEHREFYQKHSEITES
jgi:hypothetical protein